MKKTQGNLATKMRKKTSEERLVFYLKGLIFISYVALFVFSLKTQKNIFSISGKSFLWPLFYALIVAGIFFLDHKIKKRKAIYFLLGLFEAFIAILYSNSSLPWSLLFLPLHLLSGISLLLTNHWLHVFFIQIIFSSFLQFSLLFFQKTFGLWHNLAFLFILIVLNLAIINLFIFWQKREQNLKELIEKLNKKSELLALTTERQRIGRDFHDVLGGHLTCISMNCDLIKLTDESLTLAPEIYEIKNSSTEAIEEMRRSIAFFNNSFEIGEQIYLICESAKNRYQLNIVLEGNELLGVLGLKEQIACCRVVQEALTNVSKHALAQKVLVKIIQQEDSLELIIADDGCGFDKSKIGLNGLGLANIEARAEDIGAQFKLSSSPGLGTKISLTMI